MQSSKSRKSWIELGLMPQQTSLPNAKVERRMFYATTISLFIPCDRDDFGQLNPRLLNTNLSSARKPARPSLRISFILMLVKNKYSSSSSSWLMVPAIEEGEINRPAGVLHDKLTLRYAMRDFSQVRWLHDAADAYLGGLNLEHWR